jgi:hypothetical protein
MKTVAFSFVAGLALASTAYAEVYTDPHGVKWDRGIVTAIDGPATEGIIADGNETHLKGCLFVELDGPGPGKRQYAVNSTVPWFSANSAKINLAYANGLLAQVFPALLPRAIAQLSLPDADGVDAATCGAGYPFPPFDGVKMGLSGF